jgi:hypothetical protein
MAESGAGVGQGDFSELQDALRELTGEAREALTRLSDELELPRRLREQPMAVLGAAAAAGFVLGGGLWPVLRPFVKAAARSALSPGNLLAVGAALGALRAAQGRTGVEDEQPAPETH